MRSSATHPPDRPPAWRDIVALSLVALAGASCLARPFWGDQSLFALYARQLTQGAVLYRDLYDIKQPGIFLFYAVGGWLFGFTEVGIHLFELIYWLAFSVFALVALRPYFTARWAAPLVPVFTIVTYYLYAGLLDLTQIEIIVAFPLLVAWWSIDQGDPQARSGPWRYAAAGLAAAAVVLLKHLYLLIVLAFVSYAVLRARRRGISTGDIARCVGVFLVCLAGPILIAIAYFAAHGQLGRIWWAYFEMSRSAHMTTPRPLSYLMLGARRFLIGHAPLLIVAVLGCVHTFQRRAARELDLVAGMIVWGAVGAFAFIALQGWPEYKWTLFTVPLGILAVVGVEALAGIRDVRPAGFALSAPFAFLAFIAGGAAPQIQTRLLWSIVVGAGAAIAAVLPVAPRLRRGMLYVLPAALAVATGLAAIDPVSKIHALVEHDFALTADGRAQFQRGWNDSYRAADEDLEVFRSRNRLPGPIHVFGDQVLLLKLNRPQAIPIAGWAPGFLDGRGWRELDADLHSALPAYIIVDRSSESVIRSHSPGIVELIESRYEVAFVGASGTWYVRR